MQLHLDSEKPEIETEEKKDEDFFAQCDENDEDDAFTTNGNIENNNANLVSKVSLVFFLSQFDRVFQNYSFMFLKNNR